jgi:type I restriction enzyme S subunit
MEVKCGYKQTDVGVIPEQWGVKTFGQICRVNQGLQIAIDRRLKYPTPKAKTYITIQFLNDRKDAQYIADYPSSACCSKDDVLMTRTGNTGMVVSGVEGVFHNNFFKINFEKKVLNREFLIGFLSLSSTHRTILVKAGTSTIPDLNHNDFYAIALPIPPLPEQRIIATALGDVDALLEALERLIAKKRDLKQAAMQQLLTGRTRLPGFADEWVPRPLKHAGHCHRGVSYRGNSDLSTHDTARTKRLLRANNIQNFIVVLDDLQFVNADRVSSEQVLRIGDILICMANGSKLLVGKSALFKVDDGYEYTFGAFMACFRSDASVVDPNFVFYLFQTDAYRNYINNILAGSSINNLRPSSIESLVFLFPKIDEQTAIAEILTDIDAELSGLEQLLVKTQALKQAMMQELLTGKTRLVAAEAVHA